MVKVLGRRRTGDRMAKAELVYEARGHSGFRCVLTTEGGSRLVVSWHKEEVEDALSGDSHLLANPAVVSNASAYGHSEYQYRRARNDEKKESFRKQASQEAKAATAIAGMVERLGSNTVEGWCSACLSRTTHRQVDGLHAPPAFLCQACGSPTSACAARGCKHRANRSLGRARIPQFCAEHRHDIPGFNKLNKPIRTIDDYEDWLTYDSPDLAKLARTVVLVGAAATVVAPLAFVAAPAIGGALGASALGGGLSGAAAVSHGLAMVGGGSLAAGGFGMVGGTAVITAVGAGLGGAMGAGVASSYLATDKSFKIELLRAGKGSKVLLASGFLTEGQSDWGDWQSLVDARYPDNPVYRVHWGAKELKVFGSLAAASASRVAAQRFAVAMAMHASRRAAKRIPVLGNVFFAKEVVTNPWTVARTRADMTGAALADLIARTEEDRFILVGHSLGGRVMATATAALGTRTEDPKLESVHLLGAAVTRSANTRQMGNAVDEYVWNYWSSKDAVLKQLYKTAELGRSAIGQVGIKSPFPKVKDRNVSRSVANHSQYFSKVKLQ